MGLFGDFAGPEFGLDDVKIAALSSDGTYGEEVDVPSVQMYGVNLNTVNAQLEGDDEITDTHAINISAEVKLRFGSISFEALQVLLGINYVQSLGVSPDRVRTLTIGNIKFPYFGINGRAKATQDNGDTHIFVPKVKIMQGFEVGMQYGQYVIPELTCTAVRSDLYDAILQIIKHEEAKAVTIPPYTGE